MRRTRDSVPRFPSLLLGIWVANSSSAFRWDGGPSHCRRLRARGWLVSPATRQSRAAERAGGLALDGRRSGGYVCARPAGACPCLATGGGRCGGHHRFWRLDRGRGRLPRPSGPPTGTRRGEDGRPRRRGATPYHSAAKPQREFVAPVRGARCREPAIGNLAALTAASSTRLWPGTSPGRDPFAGGHNGKGGDSHARVRQSL
jgi:hypothetical protein